MDLSISLALLPFVGWVRSQSIELSEDSPDDVEQLRYMTFQITLLRHFSRAIHKNCNHICISMQCISTQNEKYFITLHHICTYMLLVLHILQWKLRVSSAEQNQPHQFVEWVDALPWYKFLTLQSSEKNGSKDIDDSSQIILFFFICE